LSSRPERRRARSGEISGAPLRMTAWWLCRSGRSGRQISTNVQTQKSPAAGRALLLACLLVKKLLLD
jgi:hypothetical protein